MSKCDVNIVLDRTNRTFRPGEEVSGTVQVRVNRDVKCNAVLLEHFWQTHGRGNKASGAKVTSTLHRGDLRAGESLSIPFSVAAPNGPPTYHGHYLNVDHYLNARVDIPWAIDPKRKEEYILLPGSRSWGHLPKTALGRNEAIKTLSQAAAPIGVGLLVVGGLCFPLFFPCGIVLIPAGLIVLFLALRKKMAESKMGAVKLNFGSLQVSPGGKIPLQLDFTPRQTSKLNRIIAKLKGEEKCVSGSGTNKTTHTHKLHEQTVELMREGDVAAGRRIQMRADVAVPQTGAFTFSASDNEVIWSLEVRIDIPLWPDWTERRPVVVRPAIEAQVVEAVAVEPQPAAAPVLPGRSAPAFAGRMEANIVDESPVVKPAVVEDYTSAVREEAVAETPIAEEPFVAKEAGSDQPPAAAVEPSTAAGASGGDFLAIVGRLVSAKKYSSEREQIVKDHAEQSFQCILEIEKVERTYAYSSDERFRNGRTATGIISGTQCKVKLQLPEERNDEVDALDSGTALSADCLLLKWDNIYDRLEMRQA